MCTLSPCSFSHVVKMDHIIWQLQIHCSSLPPCTMSFLMLLLFCFFASLFVHFTLMLLWGEMKHCLVKYFPDSKLNAQHNQKHIQFNHMHIPTNSDFVSRKRTITSHWLWTVMKQQVNKRTVCSWMCQLGKISSKTAHHNCFCLYS